MFRTASLFLIAALTTVSAFSENNPQTAGANVKMTVTASVADGKRLPQITKDDVILYKGKDRVPVLDWVAAAGERAGLELFILIDDASISSLGLQLEDLRNFINAQPDTTAIAVGYARNVGVDVRQNFTTDHALANKALRLPLGSVGAYGSPYLSAAQLMRRWSDTPNRREIVLITDGIDRAHRGRPMFNPDVNTAIDAAQRTGTMIHTIYYPGTGHWQRNYWIAMNAQNDMARLSEATGGECFALGRQAPVSFAPYLQDLQKALDNQYLLAFAVSSGKKPSAQYVKISIEIPGVDFSAPDAVWTPAK